MPQLDYAVAYSGTSTGASAGGAAGEQHPGGPGFGDHIAVGESNAVSYYNSVTGARTNKYGDYLDALTQARLAPGALVVADNSRLRTLAELLA